MVGVVNWNLMRELTRINMNRMFPNFLSSPIRESRKNFSTSKNNNVMAPDTKIIILNKEASNFFEEALSVEKLMAAWAELKGNPGFVSSKEWNNSLNNITPEWFKLTNKALIERSFKYPNRDRLYVHKLKSSGMRPIIISSPRVKIIEKALLNALEPYFEGVWEWGKSSEKKKLLIYSKTI